MAARHLAPSLERVEGGGRLALPCTSVQTHLYQRTGSRCGRAETVKFVSTGKRKRLNTTRYILLSSCRASARRFSTSATLDGTPSTR